MNVLVIGATGTVGSQVVTNLISKDVQVKCLTRSKDRLSALPENVKGYIGDLESPESVNDAFASSDAVFILNAVSPNETEQGLAAVNAAISADVKKMVYLSVPMPGNSRHIPHFKSKIPVENAIIESGIPYNIVRPNNFYQNDYWFQEALLNYKVYPQPIGQKGLTRVDTRDIGEVAAVLLTTSNFDNKEVHVNGPDNLTGMAVTETFSRHMGENINYGGDDLDSWEQQAKQMMPDWMVADMKIMYKYFQDFGFQSTAEDYELMESVLGHPPRSFDDFVAETVSFWKQ